jgi:ribosome-associated toxin RatA of RatAB toxin-antitoxin module
MCDRGGVPKISADTRVGAPPEVVFDYAADYRHATLLVPGLTRFEPTGHETSGLGASFDAAIEIGPKRYETKLAVNVFDPVRAIGWSGLPEGPSLLWTFTPDGDVTTVEFELGFDLPGGVAGTLLGFTIEPIIRSTARSTAAALKRQVEAQVLGGGEEQEE